MQHPLSPRSGFTLIETLLYMAIVSILVGAMTSLIILMLQARAKNQTIAEVEQQGIFVAQYITNMLRNGDYVTEPYIGGATSINLSAAILDPTKNPLNMTLYNGAIQTNEALTGSVNLTNTRVVASGLSFQNFSRTGTPGTVRGQFTLTAVNPSGRKEFQFQKTFTFSATLRQP